MAKKQKQNPQEQQAPRYRYDENMVNWDALEKMGVSKTSLEQQRLPEKLRRIALEFIRRLARHHDISKSTDTSYYEMAHDYLEDYRLYDEEATTGEIRRKIALARLYEKGKAHRVLERMDSSKGFLVDLEGGGNTIRRRTMSRHCWN